MNITLPPEQLRAEARARIDAALRHVENAQGELIHACAELSSLVGAIPHWRATSKLHDRVKAFWYKLDGFRWSGKYRLDSTSVEALTRRAEQSLIAKANRGLRVVR